jgi:hypothetical protein
MILRAYAQEDIGRFNGLVVFFRRYGEQYGFDYLMIAATGLPRIRSQSIGTQQGWCGWGYANETSHSA